MSIRSFNGTCGSRISANIKSKGERLARKRPQGTPHSLLVSFCWVFPAAGRRAVRQVVIREAYLLLRYFARAAERKGINVSLTCRLRVFLMSPPARYHGSDCY